MSSDTNNALAIRVAEIMNDFRLLVDGTLNLWTDPTTNAEQREAGFLLLTDTYYKSQELLGFAYPPNPAEDASPNTEHRQLMVIMLDASARRLQAKKLYLRAVSAVRNIQAKREYRQSRSANGSTDTQLDQRTRQEVSLITNETTFNDLRAVDYQAGRNTDYDPALRQVLASGIPDFRVPSF